MNRRRYILFILFLQLLALEARAQGDVVVHAPPGLDLLFNKKHAVTKPVSHKAGRPVAQAPATATGTVPATLPQPESVKKTVTLTTYSPDAPRMASSNMRLVSNIRHEHVIYSGKGFRVQIYYGPDRDKAMKIKKEFMRYYPDVRTYLSYYPPYFRIKVGNYRYRTDAMGMLREANSTYSPSMIVPDIVTISTF
jgi:hypothetical protein